MAIDRRAFLRGASACAIAAAAPAAAPVPETYHLWLMAEAERWHAQALMASPSFQRTPIFEGCMGVYNGVIIRHVDVLGEA